MNAVLLYVAAALTDVWRISHVAATRGVVKGFGELTVDNRRIVTMEWMTEGVALISLGAFVVTVTAVDASAAAATATYSVAIGTLVALAIRSLFTGFRIAFLPFRLCLAVTGLQRLGDGEDPTKAVRSGRSADGASRPTGR